MHAVHFLVTLVTEVWRRRIAAVFRRRCRARRWRVINGNQMAEYQLYCFAQSGNAYRCALMLNLIGADWEPIWVDFFAKGEQRDARIPRQGQ